MRVREGRDFELTRNRLAPLRVRRVHLVTLEYDGDSPRFGSDVLESSSEWCFYALIPVYALIIITSLVSLLSSSMHPNIAPPDTTCNPEGRTKD